MQANRGAAVADIGAGAAAAHPRGFRARAPREKDETDDEKDGMHQRKTWVPST